MAIDENIMSLLNKLIDEKMNTDSIEIGTPSKGGTLKIYFNANDLEGTKEKIKRGFDALDLARAMAARSE